jgi:hypothetical protein
MKKIETLEDITDNFEMSVDGEGQFAMFGSSDKFNFIKKQAVQTYHLFLFVHVKVTNPQTVISNVRLKPTAFDLIGRDPQRFHEEFGDFFVLATQSGGEYAALLDIHTSDSVQHDAMSNELNAAGFGGGFAFAVDAKVNLEKCRQLTTARVDIIEMEIGGQGDPTPADAAGIIDKAEKFRADVQQHGVDLRVLLQDYKALDLPPTANPVDLQHQRDVINDCFKQRIALLQALNTVEFILNSPGQFEAPAPGVDLNQFRDQLANAINVYDSAASSCLNDFRQCQLVTPAPVHPDLSQLPSLLPARKPGIVAFKGVWSNNDTGASLMSLQIDPVDALNAQITGIVMIPGPIPGVTQPVVAPGSWDNSVKALLAFLQTSPGFASGRLFHPAQGHSLQIGFDQAGTNLTISDAIGEIISPAPPVLFTFSPVA